MMTAVRLLEIPDPQGGRNILRAGDPVRVTAGPSDPSSFPATFKYAEADEDGTVTAICVVGGRGYIPGFSYDRQTGVAEWRTVVPGRVRRKSVSTHARRLES